MFLGHAVKIYRCKGWMFSGKTDKLITNLLKRLKFDILKNLFIFACEYVFPTSNDRPGLPKKI